MRRSTSLPARWHAVWLLLGCLLPVLLGLPPPAAGAETLPGGAPSGPQSAPQSGRQVKAAYLHKFTGFIEWPAGTFADSASAIVIGVIGEDDLADELERLVAKRSVNGRPLQVRKLQKGDSLAGLQVLFLGPLDKSGLPELLAGLKGRPVLTVTDSDEAYALGCMINFVLLNDKLRFEVSLPSVDASGLRISALMLAAAYRVVKEGP